MSQLFCTTTTNCTQTAQSFGPIYSNPNRISGIDSKSFIDDTNGGLIKSICRLTHIPIFTYSGIRSIRHLASQLSSSRSLREFSCFSSTFPLAHTHTRTHAHEHVVCECECVSLVTTMSLEGNENDATGDVNRNADVHRRHRLSVEMGKSWPGVRGMGKHGWGVLMQSQTTATETSS